MANMALIVVIDGAEKVGKTTTISKVKRWLEIRGISVGMRHWSQSKVDDREYSPALLIDANSTEYDVVLWDRSWASEYVYGVLLRRDKRMRFNSSLGEFLHGRIAMFSGVRFLLTTNNLKRLAKLRTDDDLKVDPINEAMLYEVYAETHKWIKLFNDYSLEGMDYNVALIGSKVVRLIKEYRNRKFPVSPPFAVGNPTFKHLIISSMIEDTPDIPGALITASGKNALCWMQDLGSQFYRSTFVERDFVTKQMLAEAGSVTIWGVETMHYINSKFGTDWSFYEWECNK